MRQKWDKIISEAKNYRWAEQSLGSTTHFPQSIYGNPFYAADSPVRKALFAATTPRYYLPNDMGIHEDSLIPFNNSNTFARYVLNQAAISWQSIGVNDFQGLALPQDVTGTWSTPVER